MRRKAAIRRKIYERYGEIEYRVVKNYNHGVVQAVTGMST